MLQYSPIGIKFHRILPYLSSGASTLLLGPLLHGGCGTSAVSLVQSLFQVASNQQNLPDNRSGEDIRQE